MTKTKTTNNKQTLLRQIIIVPILLTLLAVSTYIILIGIEISFTEKDISNYNTLAETMGCWTNNISKACSDCYVHLNSLFTTTFAGKLILLFSKNIFLEIIFQLLILILFFGPLYLLVSIINSDIVFFKKKLLKNFKK